MQGFIVFTCSKKPYNIFSFGEITVLQNSSFSFGSGYDEKIAGELFEQGKKLKDKKTVIWNLLSNEGGNSNYPMNFIKGLNDYAHWETNVGILHSPITDNKILDDGDKAHREWEFYLSPPYNLENSKYDGTLYVLINSKVASSGESAVAYAKSVKNHILIGENTAGCGTFGDTLSYTLPYSRMTMKVPYKIFLGMGKEGEGFTPDYWVDSEDVQSEVIRWLDNQDIYMPYQS